MTIFVNPTALLFEQCQFVGGFQRISAVTVLTLCSQLLEIFDNLYCDRHKVQFYTSQIRIIAIAFNVHLYSAFNMLKRIRVYGIFLYGNILESV